MKNIILKSLVILLVFTSCDIDRLPYTSQETEDLLQSEGGLQAATLGNYAILNGANGFATLMHRVTEYGGDNISLSGSTTDNFYYWYNYKNVTTNYRTDALWTLAYRAMLGINTVLELTEEGTSAEQDQLIGENYYLRAYVNFSMVNVFGRPYTQDPSAPGIPLKLNSDVDQLPARSSVSEVYQQVIADLEKAITLMTVDKKANFATSLAAKALLSRVYLYMGDGYEQQVINYATDVIESGKYSLLSTEKLDQYFTYAPEANSETIFAFKMDKDSDYIDGWPTVGSMYANIQGVGWGEMYASYSFLKLINQHPDDARLGFINPQYELDANGEKIPAVYWINDDYQYVFKPTFTQNGTLFFELDGANIQVVKETTNQGVNYYFTDANGAKVGIQKGFMMQLRNGFPLFYIMKASLQEGVPQLWSPVVSRLAEMYLNRAEAYAKSGQPEMALQDVNVIRARAGIPTYDDASDFPSGMNALDVVLQERRLEFAFEGQRKFDIFRNNRTLDRRYPGSHLYGNGPFYEVKPTDDRVIIYIPEKQIVVQPSLIQNP